MKSKNLLYKSTQKGGRKRFLKDILPSDRIRKIALATFAGVAFTLSACGKDSNRKAKTKEVSPPTEVQEVTAPTQELPVSITAVRHEIVCDVNNRDRYPEVVSSTIERDNYKVIKEITTACKRVAPVIDFSIAPEEGSTVVGDVDVAVSARSVSATIEETAIYLDSREIEKCNGGECSYIIDTTALNDGQHAITAATRDEDGLKAKTATIAFIVDNIPDSSLVTVMFSSAPTSNSTLQGDVPLEVTASSDVAEPIVGVELYIDGSRVTLCSSVPCQYVWETTRSSEGAHSVTATARDSIGTEALSERRDYIVDNIMAYSFTTTGTIGIGESYALDGTFSIVFEDLSYENRPILSIKKNGTTMVEREFSDGDFFKIVDGFKQYAVKMVGSGILTIDLNIAEPASDVSGVTEYNMANTYATLENGKEYLFGDYSVRITGFTNSPTAPTDAMYEVWNAKTLEKVDSGVWSDGQDYSFSVSGVEMLRFNSLSVNNGMINGKRSVGMEVAAGGMAKEVTQAGQQIAAIDNSQAYYDNNITTTTVVSSEVTNGTEYIVSTVKFSQPVSASVPVTSNGVTDVVDVSTLRIGVEILGETYYIQSIDPVSGTVTFYKEVTSGVIGQGESITAGTAALMLEDVSQFNSVNYAKITPSNSGQYGSPVYLKPGEIQQLNVYGEQVTAKVYDSRPLGSATGKSSQLAIIDGIMQVSSGDTNVQFGNSVAENINFVFDNQGRLTDIVIKNKR